MLEAFAQVFVQAAQPRPAHTAVDAVKGSGLGWVDELAARLGHGRSLGLRVLREHRIGRNLGSDLSEGWVSARLVGLRNIGSALSEGWVSARWFSARWFVGLAYFSARIQPRVSLQTPSLSPLFRLPSRRGA